MAKREPIDKKEVSIAEVKEEPKEFVEIKKVDTKPEAPKKKDGGCCI